MSATVLTNARGGRTGTDAGTDGAGDVVVRTRNSEYAMPAPSLLKSSDEKSRWQVGKLQKGAFDDEPEEGLPRWSRCGARG
jgi:hypothetical protein